MQQAVAHFFQFIALICLYVVPSVLMSALFHIQQSDFVVSPTVFWLFNGVILLSFVLVLWAFWTVYQRSFAANSEFSPLRPWTALTRTKLVKSLPYLAAMLLLGFVFNALMSWYTGQDYEAETANQQAIMALLEVLPAVVMVFNIVIYAPIGEELLFRGILFQYFESRWTRLTKLIAVIISALVFASLHLSQLNLPELALYATMGLILATHYLRSRDLRYPILVHMINNAVGTALLYFN